MSLDEIIAQDMEVIISDKGNKVITWQGEDYLVSASSVNTSKELASGGYDIDFNNTFTVIKTDFANGLYPTEQQKITYKGKKYRIVEVINEEIDVLIQLKCVWENK